MSATASFPTEPIAIKSHRLLMALIVTVLAVAVGVGVYLLIGAFSGGTQVDNYPPGPGSQLEQCLNTVGRTAC